MRRLAPFGLLFTVVALIPSAARAQTAEAEVLFKDAERLEAAGKTGEACDAFAASNRLEPRAGTLIRLGACREALGQLASAWSAYVDALERVRDPRKKAVAEAKLAAIEPRLSYLTVLVADESRVEGLEVSRDGVALEPRLWNRAVPVDGGTHVVTARAPGHEAWRTSVEVARERDKASIEVPRFKQLRALIADTGSAKDDPAPPVVDDHLPVRDPGRTRRWLGIGVGGAGLVAAGVGAFFAVRATSRFGDSRALCGDTGCPPGPDYDRARALSDGGLADRRLSFVFIGAGAVALAGGAVLWFTAPRAQRRVGLTLGPGRIGLGVVAGF